MNIQIKTTGFDLTEALTDHIEQRIGSMDKLFSRVESDKGGKHSAVEVFVELSKTHGGQKKGDDMYQAEIQFHLPNTDRMVVRVDSWDIHKSIDEAAREIKERILSHKGKKEAKKRRRKSLKSLIDVDIVKGEEEK